MSGPERLLEGKGLQGILRAALKLGQVSASVGREGKDFVLQGEAEAAAGGRGLLS